MSDIIRLKRSAVQGAAPTALEFGEVALNYHSSGGKLYYKNSAGEIVEFAGGSGLSWSSVPASPTAAGTAGQIAYDGNFLYIATAANTWERAALSTWSPFGPASVSGLQLWLDASDASTLYDATSGGSLVAADGTVARWQDKSGNGRHAIQSEANRRPVRKTAIVNGRDALTFDGTSDQLLADGSAFEFGSAGFSVFVVGRGDLASSDIRCILCMQANDSAQSGILRIELTTSAWQVASRSTDTGAGATTDSSSYAQDTLNVITVTRSENTLTARKNGASFGTRTISGSITRSAEGQPPPLAIGSFDSNPNYANQKAYFWSGEVCEVIVYHSTISTADREAVESYLITKWGIS